MPVRNGEPFTGVSAPVVASIAKAETCWSRRSNVDELALRVDRYRVGLRPALNGDPVTGVSAPVFASMA